MDQLSQADVRYLGVLVNHLAARIAEGVVLDFAQDNQKYCNGLALVATVTRWLKATGSLDDLKEMKRRLGSGTRLVYYLILLNLKVLST